MADNPIKFEVDYTDLDSLLKLLKTTETAIDSLTAKIKADSTVIKQSLDGVAVSSTNDKDAVLSLSKQVDVLSNNLKELKLQNEKLAKSHNDVATAIDQEKLKREKLKTSQVENKVAADNEKKALKNVEDAYKTLSNQYSVAARNAKNMGAIHGENSKQFKEAASSANVYKEKLDNIDKGVGQYQRNVGNYKSAFEGLNAVWMQGIVVIAGVVAAWTTFGKIMNSTKETGDRFEFFMAGLNSGFDSLLKTIANLDFSNLISNFTRAFTAGMELSEQLDELKDKLNGLRVLSAEARRGQAELDVLIKSNAPDSEKIAGIDKFLKKEEELGAVRVDIAKSTLLAYKQAFAEEAGISEQSIDNYIELLAHAGDYAEGIGAIVDAQEKLNKASQKDAGFDPKKQGEAISELLSITSKYSKENSLLNSKKAVESKLDEEQIEKLIKGIEDLSEADSAVLENNIKKYAKRADLIDQIRKKETEGAKKINPLEAWNKSEEERVKMEADRAKERADKDKEELARKNKLFEDERRLDEARFESATHTEEEITQFKIEQLNTRIAYLAATGDEEVDREIKILRAKIDGLNNIKSPVTKKSFVSELFNVSEKDAREIEKAMQQTADQVYNIYAESQQRKIDLQQEEIDARSDTMNDLNDQLQKEIDLEEVGAANRADAIRSQLAIEKAAQEDAMAQREKLVARQQKIDALMQVSNLLTASSKIFTAEAWAGPVGIAIAASTILGMYAIFAGLKSKKFAEGGSGIVDGPSHADGGVHVQGVGEVEGREWFGTIKKSKAGKYGQLADQFVSAANKDRMDLFALNFTKDNPIVVYNQFGELVTISNRQYNEQRETNKILQRHKTVVGKTTIDTNGNKITFV